MSQNSGMESRSCIAWETVKPISYFKLSSSHFCVFGSQCNLEMEHLPGMNWYQINLISASKEHFKMPFLVTTFIERKVNSDVVDGPPENELKCSVTLLPSITTVESSEQKIWSYSCENILESLPRFSDFEMFRIVCVFHGAPAPVQQCRSEAEMHLSDLENLSRDLCNLLEKTTVADVKLVCQGSTVSAHRAVLAARSEMFEAMFRNKMKESETGIVKVPDIELPVLQLLLQYIYSGKIPRLTDDITPKLYSASNKYALLDLKKACSDRIVRDLTKENCLGFLTLSDAHDDRDFKARVINFLRRHWAFPADAWAEFEREHPRLADEILKTVQT